MSGWAAKSDPYPLRLDRLTGCPVAGIEPGELDPGRTLAHNHEFENVTVLEVRDGAGEGQHLPLVELDGVGLTAEKKDRNEH